MTENASRQTPAALRKPSPASEEKPVEGSPEAEPAERSPEAELARALEHYSEKVVRIWVTRRNFGTLPHPDGRGLAASDCNDTIELHLRLRDGRVEDARFVSEGCGATFACGSAAAELARGKSPSGLLGITPDDVLEELDGLPPHNEHCAEMAVAALRQAAQDLLRTRQEPWKRLYR